MPQIVPIAYPKVVELLSRQFGSIWSGSNREIHDKQQVAR
jgi:hypothetical protein